MSLHPSSANNPGKRIQYRSTRSAHLAMSLQPTCEQIWIWWLEEQLKNNPRSTANYRWGALGPVSSSLTRLWPSYLLPYPVQEWQFRSDQERWPDVGEADRRSCCGLQTKVTMAFCNGKASELEPPKWKWCSGGDWGEFHLLIEHQKIKTNKQNQKIKNQINLYF